MQNHFGKKVLVAETGQCTNNASQADIPNGVHQMSLAKPFAVILYQYEDQSYFSTDPCEESFGIIDKNGNQKSAYNAVMQGMQ